MQKICEYLEKLWKKTPKMDFQAPEWQKITSQIELKAVGDPKCASKAKIFKKTPLGDVKNSIFSPKTSNWIKYPKDFPIEVVLGHRKQNQSHSECWGRKE